MLKRIVIAAAVVMALGGPAAAQGACEGPWLFTDELQELTPAQLEAEYARVRPCAERGVVGAQTELGRFYANDYAVPEDPSEIVPWVGLAAEQGDAAAQYILGVLYQLGGELLPQDFAEAMRWYRLAADQVYAGAQNNLGYMYAYGYGVPQDYAEAVRWWRLAAEQGYGPAQYNLGDIYADSRFLGRDPVLAHMWFNIAAANGSVSATQQFSPRRAAVRRDQIAVELTPEQIAEAQRLAREWLADHPN